MRLWHYQLIPYLPKSQLLAQWRELNSIFKKQDKHILINYVYGYPKSDLYNYSIMVINEMANRGYKVRNADNYINYFIDVIGKAKIKNEVFRSYHDNEYLLICYWNLKEKYDRDQIDFDDITFQKLHDFVNKELNSLLDEVEARL